jgi:hypothetical protein
MGKIDSTIVEYTVFENSRLKAAIDNNIYYKILPFKVFKYWHTLAIQVNGRFKYP